MNKMVRFLCFCVGLLSDSVDRFLLAKQLAFPGQEVIGTAKFQSSMVWWKLHKNKLVLFSRFN